MAGKVNTRFLVILGATLVVLAATVATIGYITLKGRPERDVRKADALMAQGEYRKAASLYEGAVGRNRTRRDWLEKWRDALLKVVPEGRTEYEEKYGFYIGVLRQIAVLEPRDPAPQLAYIRALDEQYRTGGASRETWERLATEVTDRMKQLDPESGETKRLARYRGLARVELMGAGQVSEDDRKAARAELEAAAAQDPADWEVRLGLARWHIAEYERLRREGRTDLAPDERREAEKVVDATVAAFPERAEPALLAYLLKQSALLEKSTDPSTAREAIRASQQDAQKVLAVALAAPPELLTSRLIEQLAGVMLGGLGQEAVGPLQELIDKGLKARPNDALLLLTLAVLQQRGGQAQASIDTCQKVVDLPDLPVSIGGLLLPQRRLAAQGLQIDSALALWNDAKTPEERTKALALAKKYRQDMSASAGLRNQNILLMRDAKIAFAEGRLDAAVKALSELKTMSAGSDADQNSLELLQMLSRTLEMQQNFGEARRVLIEMTDRFPGFAEGHIRLGEAELRLGDLKAAEASYRRAAKLEPENAEIRKRLDSIAVVNNPTESTNAQADPVVVAIVAANKQREAGDAAAARATLEEAYRKSAGDRRLVSELVQDDVRNGRRAEAIARVEEAIKLHPEDRGLIALKTSLEIEDPLQARLKLIEVSELSPQGKALERFQAYLEHGKGEEARANLAEAQKLDPDNSRVIDLSFILALGDKDFEKATQIARRAAELNIDQMNGLSYQGRLEMTQGKDREAVATFEQCVKLAPYNPAVRRLLGQAYLKVGRVQDALAALKHAYEGRPDEVANAREYARVLLVANRGPEALGVIKSVIKFAPNDEELVRLWIELEAMHGDSDRALAARRDFQKARPKDVTNGIGLAGMLMDRADWEGARAVIDSLADAPGLLPATFAALQGNWYARQARTGKPEVDGPMLDKGVKVVQDYVASLPADKVTLEDHMTLGEFLFLHGRIQDGLKAMEAARSLQDPKKQQVDRRLGDYFFEQGSAAENAEQKARTAGREDEATEHRLRADDFYAKSLVYYENVLKATGSDFAATEDVRKRLAETYIRIKKYDDALRLADDLARRSPDDLQVLLLQANIADRKGDRRAARAKFDRAVELNPGSSLTFMQRAQFNLSDPAMTADAVKDLEQVVRLRPSNIPAWIMLYSTMSQQGRQDEAFAVLKRGVDANPSSDELRLRLIRDLALANRGERAQAEVIAAVEAREESLQWLALGAQIMAQVGRWQDAADLYRKLYEKSPKAEVAGALLDSLLHPGLTPKREEVAKLWKQLDDIDDEQNVGDVMLRARVDAYLGKAEDSDKFVLKARALLGNNGLDVMTFMSQLDLITASREKSLALISRWDAEEDINPVLSSIVLNSKLARGTPASGLLSEAVALEKRCGDDVARLELKKLLARMYLDLKQYPEAAKATEEALTILAKFERRDIPAEVELNNNLSYMLTTYLKDPQKGLPFAEAAAQLAPRSSTVLDTKGWTLHLLGKHKEAQEVMEEAVRYATDQPEAMIAHLHHGMVLVALGDKGAARKELAEAEKISDLSEQARRLYSSELDSLRKALE